MCVCTGIISMVVARIASVDTAAKHRQQHIVRHACSRQHQRPCCVVHVCAGDCAGQPAAEGHPQCADGAEWVQAGGHQPDLVAEGGGCADQGRWEVERLVGRKRERVGGDVTTHSSAVVTAGLRRLHLVSVFSWEDLQMKTECALCKSDRVPAACDCDTVCLCVVPQVNKGSSVPKKLRYVTGLRGGPDTKMAVVSLELDVHGKGEGVLQHPAGRRQ